MIKAYELTLGEHRGNKRVWIESKKISETSLSNTMRYEPVYDMEAKKIILKKGDSHKITHRKKSNRPLIDINNSKVSEIFESNKRIIVKLFNDKIEISPSHEDTEQQRASNKNNSYNPTFIEAFAGGGTLVRSLRDAGLKPVAAIELEDAYLENLEANNKDEDLFTYCGDLSRLDIGLLPDADIVSGGIPCEGYSKSQLSKSKKESHPTGSLGFFFLKIIDHIRPSVVLIEEVPDFGNSAMAAMARYVLRGMGYNISETMLLGTDKGSLAKRKRYCMVASMKSKFVFDETKWKTNKTISDILEIPLEDRDWLDATNSGTIAYSLKAEIEHKKKGNGFKIGRTSHTDDNAVTITKGYYKGRLTDPILIHPTKKDTFSWFTPRELARINGLPEDYILIDDLPKTRAGEVIGQGVCYQSFNELGKDILRHFRESKQVDDKIIKTPQQIMSDGGNLLDLMECA